MSEEDYDEKYDNAAGKEEELDEDMDDMPVAEQGFLRGYQEDEEDAEVQKVEEEEFEF